jgi:hypothetical protein
MYDELTFALVWMRAALQIHIHSLLWPLVEHIPSYDSRRVVVVDRDSCPKSVHTAHSRICQSSTLCDLHLMRHRAFGWYVTALSRDKVSSSTSRDGTLRAFL